jgi:hypothetical protein
MAHFYIEADDDGIAAQILKDGQPYKGPFVLEAVHSIPSTYFRLGQMNLDTMKKCSEASDRRLFGLQAFLMSLTGLEAFINTYYHLRAKELGSDEIIDKINQRHGSLGKKIEELVGLAADGNLNDQPVLLSRVRALSALRNEIVHPRWVPASMTIGGTSELIIQDLVESAQAKFEDTVFCGKTLQWCLLIVVRIAQTRIDGELSGFMFHWTGKYGFKVSEFLKLFDHDDVI